MSYRSFSFPSGVHSVAVAPFYEESVESQCDDVDWGKDCLPPTKTVLDLKMYEDYLENFLMLSSISGLVLLGTTTESPCLSKEEQIGLVNTAKTVTKNKLFLTAGIGGSNTLECIKMAIELRGLCNGFMVTVPPYNKPVSRGMIAHCIACAGHDPTYRYLKGYSDLQNYPFMIYNIPSRTGVNMSPKEIVEVALKCPNVCAVKEASGNISQVDELCQLTRDFENFKVFAGDDSMLLSTCSVGGHGVISVIANAYPNEMTLLYKKCAEGKFSEGLELHNMLSPLIKAIFCETNPVPIKTLMCMNRLYEYPTVRLPMVKLSDENYERLYKSKTQFEKNLKKYNDSRRSDFERKQYD
jgi:4-hydroxy-tetrahydrodipicolinate synthase